MKSLIIDDYDAMGFAMKAEFEFWNEHADLEICIPSLQAIPETLDEPFPFAGETLHTYGGEVTIPNAPATWIEVMQAIDDAIFASDDHHHVYVESFDRDEDGRVILFLGS